MRVTCFTAQNNFPSDAGFHSPLLSPPTCVKRGRHSLLHLDASLFSELRDDLSCLQQIWKQIWKSEKEFDS